MASTSISKQTSLHSTYLRLDPSDVVPPFSADSVDESSGPSPHSGVDTSLSGMTAVSSHLSLASTKFTCSEVDDKIAEYQFLQKYDTKKLLTRMKAVALKAGDMMLNADITTIDTKNNTSDLVTETDKAIESMIKTELLTSFPSFEFFGEETSKQNQKLSDEPTFVVDPIDGTLNFTHGLPNFAVSIAIVYFKLPVAGIIYKPSTDEMWSAVTGSGAFKEHPNLDQERHNHALALQLLTAELHALKTGQQQPPPPEPADRSTRLPLRPPIPLCALNQSLLALEWGNERSGPRWRTRLALHASLLTTSPTGSMIQSIRSLGSAALDFCYVAEGRLDAFYEPGCRVWDIAAGWVILKQAGGKVFGVNPGDFEPTVEGRCYFAIRGAAGEGSQRAFAEEVWGRLGEGRFVYGEEQGVKGKVEESEDGLEMRGWAKQDRVRCSEGVVKPALAVGA